MREQSYYRLSNSEDNNIEIANDYLVVNCAGTAALEHPFFSKMPYGRNDFYVQYVVEGEMIIYIDKQPTPLKKGQAVCHYAHTPCFYKNKTNEVAYYWIHFTGAYARELLLTCKIENQVVYEIGINDAILKSFHTLFGEFLMRDACFKAACAARLIDILSNFGRITSERGVSSSEILYDSMAYIHQCFTMNISIEELAEKEHLSVSHYRRLFKNNIGLSPRSYITYLKIQKAKELIFTTDLTIGEIASLCGYTDSLYFSRIFKCAVGVSPSKYKSHFSEL